MHIVCSSCATINRIPQGKSLVQAHCGKCKQHVYTGEPINLDDTSFNRYIEKNDAPIIVDFWADWCGPCKTMAPTFNKVAAESSDILFAKVNTELAQQVGSKAGIRSIPTLIFFHKGKEIERVSGALSEQQLKQFIMQCVGKI